MAMLPSLLLLLIFAPASAAPPEGAPVGESDGASEEVGFSEALEAGKQLYFGGRLGAAHEALVALRGRLDRGEEVERELRAELLIWLGEVQYHLGRTDEARESFRTLLRASPEYPISPYAHPLEVVGEFELVRREILDEREQRGPPFQPSVERPPPAPAWVWAPLGVPQFAQRRVGAGLVFGGLQVGLGAASIAMYVHLDRNNRDPLEPHLAPTGLGDDDVRPWVDQRRYRLQWPLTAAFYGTWLVSSLEARHHWRKHHGPSVTLGPLPRGGSGVLITSDF